MCTNKMTDLFIIWIIVLLYLLDFQMAEKSHFTLKLWFYVKSLAPLGGSRDQSSYSWQIISILFGETTSFMHLVFYLLLIGIWNYALDKLYKST